MATTTTLLTPNSQCVVTMSAAMAQVSFQVLPAGTTYWSPQVSTSVTTMSLSKDVGNNVVTFISGLTVSLSALQGGGYVVLVSGHINDSGAMYTLSGLVIGTYAPT